MLRQEKTAGQLADLSPLHGLSLKVLWLNHTHVEDLWPLKNMPLAALDISDPRGARPRTALLLAAHGSC